MYTYMIPCLLGLEKPVGDEIKRLGLSDVQVENGRVFCRGSLADCARLNINLRCGARVMLVLKTFTARSFEELFQGTKSVRWEDFLPRDAAFPVKEVHQGGAGDGFFAALSLRLLDEGTDVSEAMRYATAVGAMTVMRRGEADALPDAGEVERFLDSYDPV